MHVVCVCDILTRVALTVWGLDTACGCQLLSFFPPPSFPFSFDKTHFRSVPFRLKFLWLQRILFATANCPSTWPNCDREEEAENEI